MDLSNNRDQWLDSQILRTVLIGEGNLSPYALCSLNGDMFFRATNGVNSYRNTRQEFQTQWNQAPISLDVRKWISADRRDLLQFNSQVAFDNYLISTCSPLVAAPNNPFAGFHRFHRGMVVLDCEPESTSSRTGQPIWYGLWEGIRPTQLVEGKINDSHRCFAFSYDQDGFNRLYEIERDGISDVFEGTNRKIFSFYDTADLSLVDGVTNAFQPKNLQGGIVELSEIREEVTASVAIRPESAACFVDLDQWTAGCDCPPADCFPFTQPQWNRKFFAGFDGKCIPGTSTVLKSLRHFQGRVSLTGAAKVERMVFSFTVDQSPETRATCGNDDGCMQITCCSEAASFQYQLAPEGTNPNVPFIPTPSDVVPEWNSTQIYTANCPPPTTGNSVTASGSFTSNVSQADADAHALNIAIHNAVSQLHCRGCTPNSLLVADVTAMTNLDVSAFFATGYAPSAAGQIWRIIDLETLEIFGSGTIDASGTLLIGYSIVIAGGGGNYGFDNMLLEVVNETASNIPVALQVACPSPSGPVYPPNDNPYY